MVGKKFNKLTVIELLESGNRGEAQYLCRCECGGTKICLGTKLRKNRVKSCGCLHSHPPRNDTSLDLTNQKFGKLTALFKTEKRYVDGGAYWLCKCDCEPNKFVEVLAQRLKNGETQSCGCKRKRGYGRAAFRNLWNSYILSARKRNLAFELTETQFEFLTKQNCYYCGAEPFCIKKSVDYYGNYVYNGIDRTKNDIGYLFDNCVTCCKYCNYAKNKMTVEQFLKWLEKIIKHQNEIRTNSNIT